MITTMYRATNSFSGIVTERKTKMIPLVSHDMLADYMKDGKPVLMTY